MKALLFALFVANSALAQPIVGPELTTPPVDRGGDIAIAAQRDGYVVAWSTAGHILAGHLDSTLQLTDPPLDIDLGNAAGFPTSLSIATNGESVLVEWLETKPYASGIHAATLSGDARTVRHTPELVELGSPAAVVAGVTGRFYEIIWPAHSFVYDDDLVLRETASVANWTAAAFSVRGDAALGDVRDVSGLCWGACAYRVYRVSFTTPWGTAHWDYTPWPPVLYGPNPVRNALIAPHGDFFVAVIQTTLTDGFVTEITPEATSHEWKLDRLTPSVNAIGGNGSDVLLVWSQPLRGMLLHADGTASALFSISSDGYSPKIIAANSNEFVVVYRYDIDAQHSTIAGRIIQLQPSKRRGAH